LGELFDETAMFFYRGTKRLSTPRNVPIKLFIAQHAINVNLMCSGSHKNFVFLDKMFKVELVGGWL
jgi:hypothetical protein